MTARKRVVTATDLADDVPADEEFCARIVQSSYRPRSQSEAQVTEAARRWLNVQRNCAWRKVHGGMYSGGGEPDLDICWRGRAVKIELKADAGPRATQPKPTPAQHRRMLEWQAAGAVVGWAHHLDGVRKILERVDDPGYTYHGQANGED